GFWTGVGVLCLVLAARCLRRASARQLERRPGRWLWLLRPRVGDDPVLWRERHVIGLAPLPWLRQVPTWMGLLRVFIFSALLAGSMTHIHFLPALEQGDFKKALQMFRNFNQDAWGGGNEIIFLGLVQVVLGALVVGVRCADSVAEEKRRHTWEDL